MAIYPILRRCFTLLAAVSFFAVLSPLPSSGAGSTLYFTDIRDHWAKNDIVEMAGYGLISGIGQDRFGPQDPVTYEQALTFLGRLTDIKGESDLPFPASSYAVPYISGAWQKGWLGDKTPADFRQPASRAWVVEVMVRALSNSIQTPEAKEVFSDIGHLPQEKRDLLNRGYALGLARGVDEGGKTYFLPDKQVSRAEMISFLKRFYLAAKGPLKLPALTTKVNVVAPETPAEKPRRIYGYLVETLHGDGRPTEELARAERFIDDYGQNLSHVILMSYYFWDTVYKDQWTDMRHQIDQTVYLHSDASDTTHPVHRHLKKLHDKGIKTVLCLQNWHIREGRFDADLAQRHFADPKIRAQVVKDIVHLVERDGHVGANINFEFMHPQTQPHFTAFLRELKSALQAKGLELSVTLPVFMSNSQYGDHGYDLAAIGEIADFVMFMVYDEHVPYEERRGPSAPFTWIPRAIEHLTRTVPSSKFMLVMQTNGWVWSSPSLNIPLPGRSDSEAPMYLIPQLMAQYGAQRHWDEKEKTPYLTFDANGVGYEIWYDDAQSLLAKAQYVKDYDLPGVVIWRMGAETADFWQAMGGFLKPSR